MVGTEAALIVRREGPQHMIALLETALRQYTHYGLQESEVAQNMKKIIKKLQSSGEIGYIPQVEVLHEFRGRGHARSLIQAALWDIFQTQNLSFATAIVEDDNPYGEYMRKAFEKEGFSSIYCPATHDRSRNPAYHLMYKEKNTSP